MSIKQNVQQILGELSEGVQLVAAAKTRTPEEILEAVDAEVVLISVGGDNRFGHPCDEVLERLGDLPVYRTDEHGAVEMITGGARVWVEVQRGD